MQSDVHLRFDQVGNSSQFKLLSLKLDLAALYKPAISIFLKPGAQKSYHIGTNRNNPIYMSLLNHEILIHYKW